MPFTITYDNKSDLLPVASNPLALVPPPPEDETPAWQIYPLAQMWRMWNERLLITGKLQRWTSTGIVDYYVYDIMDIVFDENLAIRGGSLGSVIGYGGYKFGTVETPRKSIEDAVIEPLANLQDWRVWSYIQHWISNYCTFWINIDTQERYVDFASFSEHALAGDAPDEHGFKRSRDGVEFEYGYIRPGDIIGAWIVEDIMRALSYMRIAAYKFHIGAVDAFDNYAALLTGNYDTDEPRLAVFWSNQNDPDVSDDNNFEFFEKNIFLCVNKTVSTSSPVSFFANSNRINIFNLRNESFLDIFDIYEYYPVIEGVSSRREATGGISKSETVYPFIPYLGINSLIISRIVTNKSYGDSSYYPDALKSFFACPISEQPMPGYRDDAYEITKDNYKMKDLFFEQNSLISLHDSENNYFKIDSLSSEIKIGSVAEQQQIIWKVFLRNYKTIIKFSVQGLLGDIKAESDGFCQEIYFDDGGDGVPGYYEIESC